MVLVHTSDWFSGMVLPASIPAFDNLIGVFGEGDFWSGGTAVGKIQVTYTSTTTPSATTFYYSGALEHIFVDDGTGSYSEAKTGDIYTGQFSSGNSVNDGLPVLPCLNDECEYAFSGPEITASISDGAMAESGTGALVAIWDQYNLEVDDAAFINVLPEISWPVGTLLDGWLGDSSPRKGDDTSRLGVGRSWVFRR